MRNCSYENPNRLPGLDGLRGIAALIVVLSHTSNRGMFLANGLDFSGIGKSGVYLFFVLSAMLLTNQMIRWEPLDFVQFGKLFHYFQRRVFRIWPLFIIVVFVCLLTTLYGQPFLRGDGLPARITPEQLWVALFLIEEKTLLWTVAVEFKFYFLLPILCFFIVMLRDQMLVSLITLGGLILLANWYFPPEVGGASPGPFLTIFLMGTASAVIYNAVRYKQINCTGWLEVLAWAMVLVYVVTIPSIFTQITGILVKRNFLHEQHLLFAGIWSVLLLSMLLGKGWLRRIIDTAPLRFLGSISYSLYLWHLAVVKPVLLGLTLEPWLMAWVSVSGAILLATVSYYFLERPVLSWSASLGRKPGN